MTVGAAIEQGKIADFKTQKLSAYLPSLTGNDADATWWHVLTQSTGFDYPGCEISTDYLPGQMWTYSDLNLKNLTEALYVAWGNPGGGYGSINYQNLLKEAYFDAIGMQGWSARLSSDGIRLVLDLEDMGRLGILLLAKTRLERPGTGPPVVRRRDGDQADPGYAGQLQRLQRRGHGMGFDVRISRSALRLFDLGQHRRGFLSRRRYPLGFRPGRRRPRTCCGTNKTASFLRRLA